MTDNEMMRMQQEALKRTQEMQRRAASFGQSRTREAVPAKDTSVPEPPTVTTVHSHEEETEPIEKTKPQHQEQEQRSVMSDTNHSAKSGGIFETLFRDKEKTLILGILLLLMDEKTDNGLLMALMYLLI